MRRLTEALTQDEIQRLDDHFRYYNPQAYSHWTQYEVIPFSKLETKEDMKEVLDHLHTFLQSEDYVATASIFTKRFAYYIVTGILVPMSAFDKAPVLDKDRLKLIRVDEDKNWFPKLEGNHEHVTSPGNGSREEWVHDIAEETFANVVRPIFVNVQQVSKLPMKTMWENLAIYIFWFYELFYPEFTTENHHRIQQDFHYLVQSLEGDAFGEKRNPLTYFQRQDCLKNGTRMRKFCCMTYKLNEQSNYCRTCPNSP